ncbi:hypothetical protein THRCLA_23423 [Thraustotheca clavata]|uniref:Uncharacterized protein n=1 Tax=Thraustotheca clavata TaxID=74557 RepID=A0A1V9Y5Q6_9STRA|nr:hypothetical protein THRCLA_23423 [Thraustotheca clavata]
MFKSFHRESNPVTKERSKPTSVLKQWFKQAVQQQPHCTCSKPKKPTKKKKVKSRSFTYPVVVNIPKKYENEKKSRMLVGNRLVVFLPSQVAATRTVRQEFDLYPLIEEEKHLCEYCLSKSNVTHVGADDEEEDEEY